MNYARHIAALLCFLSPLSLVAMRGHRKGHHARHPAPAAAAPVARLGVNDYSTFPQRVADDTINKKKIIECDAIVHQLRARMNILTPLQLKQALCSFYCLNYLSAEEIEQCSVLKDFLHVLAADTALYADFPHKIELARGVIAFLEAVHKKADKEACATAPLKTSGEYPLPSWLAKKAPTEGSSTSCQKASAAVKKQGKITELMDLCSRHFREYEQKLIKDVEARYAPVRELVVSHQLALQEVNAMKEQLEEATKRIAQLETAAAEQKRQNQNKRNNGWTRNQRTEKAELAKLCTEAGEQLPSKKEALYDLQSELQNNKKLISELRTALFRFHKLSIFLCHNNGCKIVGDLCLLDPHMVEAIFMLEEESNFKQKACRALKEFAPRDDLRRRLFRALQEYICCSHDISTATSVKGICWEVTVALYLHNKGLLARWGHKAIQAGTTFFREIDFVLKDGRFIECKNMTDFGEEKLLEIKQQLIDQVDIAQSLTTRLILLSKQDLKSDLGKDIEMIGNKLTFLRPPRREIECCDPVSAPHFPEFGELFKFGGAYYDFEN